MIAHHPQSSDTDQPSFTRGDMYQDWDEPGVRDVELLRLAGRLLWPPAAILMVLTPLNIWLAWGLVG